jgi:Tol biopolymer transport system component
MALPAGARLGPYEVIGKLGAGGMGDVYRARDSTLNRDVALKLLPEAFAFDADRLGRFKREAQILASLNHHNIAAIYGFEQSNGVQALVLELVEGPTLADRMAQGPIPVDEALSIARQIAEALEAAHEQRIIHRDLKPANVKLRPDGTVKVLDFGLAKALEADRSIGDGSTELAAVTGAMTEAGMILGTPAYMSPEQARGTPANRRSDVWAFGVVLYEMLSGRRPFKGQGIADTLAAVLRQDVDWTVLPAKTPMSVRRLIARCLERDVRRRLADIGEARIVLEDPGATLIGDPWETAMAGAARRGSISQRAIPVVLAAITAGALVAAAASYLKPSAPPAVTRFPIVLPQGQTLYAPVTRHLVALSPDGAQMAYTANAQLYLRSMSEFDARPVPGLEQSPVVTEPVFSPDGRWLAFYSFPDQTLKRVPVSGGAAETICFVENLHGLSWGPDGIVFGQNGRSIMRIPPDGGTPEEIARVEEGQAAHLPQILPGGEHVLFTLATGSAPDRWHTARIVAQSIASREQTTLVEGGSEARYAPTGHLVYASGGTLLAVAFDPRRLTVKGAPVTIIEGIRRVDVAAHFSFSDSGTLVYVPGPVTAAPHLMEIGLIDRSGRAEPVNLPPGPYLMPRVSPDGTRVAFGTDDGNEAIIWSYDLSGATARRRVTFGGNNRFPVWSGDSKRIAFQSDREGDAAIFEQPADGAGAAQRLTRPEPGAVHVPESWSPAADWMLYSVTNGSESSLWTISLKDKSTAPFSRVRSSGPTNAVFSPDGRWVAYSTTEGGTSTTYVEPFPATGVKHQLFSKDGDSPREVVWSPDGKALFYNSRALGFATVEVTTTPSLAFGNPVAVPRPFQLSPPGGRRVYDIMRDGRFVGFTATIIAPQMQVVLNWFEELKARVPVN